MLKGTLFSVRRSFALEAEPVGRNHCGIGQIKFDIECIVTTNKLDSKGFVIDNAAYAKIAQGLLPTLPVNPGPKIDIEKEIHLFWHRMPAHDKARASDIMSDEGLDEAFKYVRELYLLRNPITPVRTLMDVSCEEFAGKLVEAIYEKMLDEWDKKDIIHIQVKIGPTGLDANATAEWKNHS